MDLGDHAPEGDSDFPYCPNCERHTGDLATVGRCDECGEWM